MVDMAELQRETHPPYPLGVLDAAVVATCTDVKAGTEIAVVTTDASASADVVTIVDLVISFEIFAYYPYNARNN